MANLNGWLTINRLNGQGNAIVTLDASALTELGERNASLRIKTSSKEAFINLNQKHYEEPLIPDNIPNNQLWVKSRDDKEVKFTSGHEDFEYDVVNTEVRTDGWKIFTFGGDITYIPQSIFSGNSHLQEVVIPKTITSIHRSAFTSCYYLESIIMSEGVIEIGQSAFNECGLKSITIPDSVTTIKDKAFYRCDEATSITIGSGVTSIGDGAFSTTDFSSHRELKLSLSSIVVSPYNSKYDSRDNCNCLIETTTNTVLKGSSNSFIPDSIVAIGAYAFHLVNITSIVIPNSVKYIYNYAFSNTNLTSITIGDGLISMGLRIFAWCVDLSLITCYCITAPKIENSTFANVKRNGILVYPSGADGYYNWLSTSSTYLGYYGWTGSPY